MLVLYLGPSCEMFKKGLEADLGSRYQDMAQE
jgi:hypothetical protein